MATPLAGDGVLALMPQEVVNSIDTGPSSPEAPLGGSPEKSPILVIVYFQKAIWSELNRLHHDAVELATSDSGDVFSLAERCIFLFDIYQHHCNAEDEEVVPYNEFEKRIRSEVIPSNEIGVTFDDIGAWDEIKESLQELIMLPLQRPDLFKGGLLKPCRGVLLIFVDEVDGMLGQRTRVGEPETMRRIKNEFMTRWDGLLTKFGERILVLAATNRPFDLDEAIIRRFEHRIMVGAVGLPSASSRELILKKLLLKEKVEALDYKELATMTEGYSGSDLNVLLGCPATEYSH